MASLQGAIFLYTWNNGVIENLRVEKNLIYSNPPGNFPALVNRADIRGSERMIRENQIYSGSPWMIDSNKNVDFQNNRYETCGGESTKWTFDGHTYPSFEDYRVGASQERGSTWKWNPLPASCFTREQSLAAESAGGQAKKNGATAPGATTPAWTLVSEIPASIDAQGLLDAASAGQLLVLKNLDMQFRPSGLRTRIKLNLKQASTEDSVQTVIRDLAMKDVETSRSTGGGSSSRPRTRLVAPDGSIVQEWQDFVGPVEIGLAVRRALGMPLFSQMTPTVE